MGKMTSDSRVRQLEERVAQLEALLSTEKEDKILVIRELRDSTDKNIKLDSDNSQLQYTIKNINM